MVSSNGAYYGLYSRITVLPAGLTGGSGHGAARGRGLRYAETNGSWSARVAANHAYRLLNVFTRGAEVLSGNPLCVFENGAAFDDRTLQALARQFNLSETTFILPSSRASARVRIFTPSYEMPFAGHPTLGTAHVCRALGIGGSELTLEMDAGVFSRRARLFWKIRQPGPPPRISAAGTSRWGASCRVGSRSRKASRRGDRRLST